MEILKFFQIFLLKPIFWRLFGVFLITIEIENLVISRIVYANSYYILQILHVQIFDCEKTLKQKSQWWSDGSIGSGTVKFENRRNFAVSAVGKMREQGVESGERVTDGVAKNI